MASNNLEWNALRGQRVDSRFTSCIITSQQNNNDLLNSSNKPRPDPQIKVHLQRRQETGDCDSHRNNTSLLSPILIHNTDRHTGNESDSWAGREDCVNTYQVVNTLSVWATMKDTKAATSGMFVNPAYCAVLAAAATADSSTPPAVNNLMAVACFLRPHSPWILFPLRNLWISCPCPCSELALTLTPVCPPAWIQQKFGKLRFAFHRAIWVVDRTDLHAITPARFSTSTVPTAMDYARLHLHCTTCFALLCLRWFKDELNL